LLDQVAPVSAPAPASMPWASMPWASMPSGSADDQHRAGGVMGDLVGHRTEQEAPRAGHALVAHDDEVRLLLLGDLKDRSGGLALAGVGVHLDARLARDVGGVVQARIDRPADVLRRVAAFLAQALFGNGRIRAH